MIRAITVLVIAGACAAPPVAAREGDGLLGTRPPEFAAMAWINGGPLTLEGLRGKVVLVRFWTDTCPYCEATAPALNTLHEEFGGRGLVVIGVYHPKPPREEPVETVKQSSRRLGFEFPIALDNDWTNLKRLWLDRVETGWTSSSFLLDREGVIRWVHPGGEYHEGGGKGHARCREAYAALRGSIERLLEDPPR